MENTELVKRLERVERDNQRLKLALGALMLVLAAVPLIGAVTPEQIPEVITAREFRTVDENGNARSMMTANGFVYWDDNGTQRAAMSELGIFYSDENGNALAGMHTDGMIYYNENGNFRSRVAALGFFHYDEDGKVVWSAPER